jgi:hypothetical protein
MKFRLIVLLLAAGASVPLQAQFDEYYEIETDPAAFVANGYSLHAGYAFGSARIDAGLFGADVPETFHGNSGWKERTDGIAIKLDYYPCGCGTDGFFAGPEADYSTAKFTLTATGGSATRGQLGVGGRAGYRFTFGETGFYLVPWLGLDYVFRGPDVMIDGSTFRQSPFRLFPALHLGWRF